MLLTQAEIIIWVLAEQSFRHGIERRLAWSGRNRSGRSLVGLAFGGRSSLRTWRILEQISELARRLAAIEPKQAGGRRDEDPTYSRSHQHALRRPGRIQPAGAKGC